MPLPFEDREQFPGFWLAFWRTLQLPFRNPLGFFERIAEGEGFGAPFRFILVLSLPVYLFLCIYPVMFGFMGLVERLAPSTPSAEPPFHWFALGCAGTVLLAPVFQVGGTLLMGLLLHLSQWIWGVRSPERGLHQNLRAVLYASGFMILGLWTPLGPLAPLAIGIYLGLGLARLHRVAPWRGVLATLSPVLLCCCLGLGSLFTVLLIQKPGSAPPPSAQAAASADDSVLANVELTRSTLERMPIAGRSPEAFVEELLAGPGFGYPEARNPFGGTESPFRRGLPESPGQVGLVPLRDYLDPATGRRHRAAVLIVGRLNRGERQALVSLDGPKAK